MTITRPAAVAGMFYPGRPEVLAADIDRYLAGAAAPHGPDPVALIVPHAGYVYSGPVAASAYVYLAAMAHHIERVVLVGPSHYEWFRGLALPGADRLATPLGEIVVDGSLEAVAAEHDSVVVSPIAHAREHSLEVQLPFLQKRLGDFTVITLLTGDIAPEGVADVIESLWGDATIVVISSDLSHYHDYETARRLDAVTAEAIVDRRWRDLGRESACGRTAVQGMLEVAGRRDLAVELLDLRNSGDTAGDRDRVVGYASFLVR